jgi:hypothetical protein
VIRTGYEEFPIQQNAPPVHEIGRDRKRVATLTGVTFSVCWPERFTPVVLAPRRADRELPLRRPTEVDFPEMPKCRVLLPESFAFAISRSRQLAPSVPHPSGLSPASRGKVFGCERFYYKSAGVSTS